MPELHWTAILLGGATALLIGLVLSIAASATGSELLGAVAVPAGIAAGGAVAGRVAGYAGALHGGLVAVLWVVSEALADSLGAQVADPLLDAARTLVGDVVRLAVGAAFGWIGVVSRR
jgi:hypothetical protein